LQKNHNTLRIFLILISTFYILAGFTLPASAQSVPIIKIDTESSSVVLGQPFTIYISVVNVASLYGVEVDLKWNPTILSVSKIVTRLGVESFSDGILHESTSSPSIFIAENNLTQNTGEFRLVATSVAPALPFSGSGNIVEITFNTLSTGNSVLDLETQLSDYPPENRDPRISYLIDHTTQDSSVTIIAQSGSTNSPTPQQTNQQTSTTPTVQPSSTANCTATVIPTQQPENQIPLPYPALVLVALVILIVSALFILKSRKKAKFSK